MQLTRLINSEMGSNESQGSFMRFYSYFQFSRAQSGSEIFFLSKRKEYISQDSINILSIYIVVAQKELDSKSDLAKAAVKAYSRIRLCS